MKKPFVINEDNGKKIYKKLYCYSFFKENRDKETELEILRIIKEGKKYNLGCPCVIYNKKEKEDFIKRIKQTYGEIFIDSNSFVKYNDRICKCEDYYFEAY